MDKLRKAQLKINKQKSIQRAKEFIAAYFLTHNCVDCGESDSYVLTFDHVRGEKHYNIADMVQGGYGLQSIAAEIEEKTEVVCFNCHAIRTHKRSESYRWKRVNGGYKSMLKRAWVRRDRENESYCRSCKTWKPKEEFNYRDVEQGLLAYDCRQCAQEHRRNSYANHRETARTSNDEWTRRAVEIAQAYVYEYLSTRSCVYCGNNNVLTLTFDHVRGTKKGNVADMVGRGRSIETIKAEISKCDVVCFNCHMKRERMMRGER